MLNQIRGKIAEFIGPKNTGATSGVISPHRWMIDWVRGGSVSDSGIPITWDSALSYPPVWYAVNKLCGHMAQIPIHMMRRLPRGAEVALNQQADYLLNVEPNSYQMPATFKEEIMLHSLLKGNGRAVVIMNGSKIEELLPIHPDRTETKMIQGEKWHITTVRADDRLELFRDLEYIHAVGNRFAIHDRYVLHIPGLSTDGVAGLSLMHLARNSWGMGLAAEKTSNKSFSNGARPGGVVTAPVGTFNTEEEASEFTTDWNKFFRGVDNAGKWGLLKDGMQAVPMGSGGDHREWVDQRKFQRQEAALWFLLETILGDDASVSYNSLEQKNLAYLVNSLMRWIVKWEQECMRKLTTQRQRERRTHYFRFNVASLLRADSKTTMQTLSMGVKSRIYNPNECREKLDLNPYDGGDEYLNPFTTSGGGGDSGSDDGDDGGNDEEKDASNASRLAIRSRVDHLIGVECKRVIAASASGGNFLDWLDKFYDGWSNTFERAVTELGGTEEQSRLYCERSHELLLELSGTITSDEDWPAAVAGLVEQWPERAGEMADKILETEEVS